MKKNKNTLSDSDGIVYSTGTIKQNFFSDFGDQEPKKNEKESLRIHLDRLPGGKLLTRINGFKNGEQEAENLCKELKKLCGVGGGLKNNEILLQGNHRDKVLATLLFKGYPVKKAGG